MRRLITGTLLAAVGTYAVVHFVGGARSDYTVSAMMPDATNVHVGGSVLVNGFDVGKVERLEAVDGKARVTLKLHGIDKLHEGATARIAWKALLGERRVDINDGPQTNAEIPDGGMLKAEVAVPANVDQVLNTLDAPTRTHIASLIKELGNTVNQQKTQEDLRDTLVSAGPALQALGGVLDGLGTDGPAIKSLVAELNGMAGVLARNQAAIRTMTEQLTIATRAAAGESGQLRASLGKLPETLQQATRTLDEVPASAQQVVPLLNDLRPATSRLRSVAQNLRPLLQDLRPVSANLRPTLAAATSLLRQTPSLLDSSHAVLPGVTNTLGQLQPVLSFVRPYTPELVAFFSIWNGVASNYGATGHYLRLFATTGAMNPYDSPGFVPPGYQKDPSPLPGQAADQPWTDAFGSAEK